MVAILMVAAQVVIGTSCGLIAGACGGWVEALLMRVTDIVLAFPGLLLAIFIAGTLGVGLRSGLIGLSLLAWPTAARLVAAETRRLKAREFVEGARAIGAGDLRVMLRHVLPNAFRPVVAIVPFTAAFAILGEAGLSFLGVGVQPPTPSWGGLVRDFSARIQTHLLLLCFPAAALALTTLALNYVAEFVQDRLDPLSRVAAR